MYEYYEAVYEAGSDSFFTELKHHSDTLGYQEGRRFDMVGLNIQGRYSFENLLPDIEHHF